MPDGVEETLGTISLCADSIAKHDSPKLLYDAVTTEDALPSTTPDEPPSEEPFRGEPRRAEMQGREAQAPSAELAGEGEAADADELASYKLPPLPGYPGGPVRPGTEEAFFLLATYCFDLQRKMEYLYKATRKFARQGDPVIARQLLEDERRINAPGLTWKQRAFRAELRMLELQREIGREHRRLLWEVAHSTGPSGQGTKEQQREEGGETPGRPPAEL